MLTAHAARLDRIRFHVAPTDRVWLRDSAPIGVHDPAGEVVLLDWKFNAWAKYDNWALDDRVGTAVASHHRPSTRRAGARRRRAHRARGRGHRHQRRRAHARHRRMAAERRPDSKSRALSRRLRADLRRVARHPTRRSGSARGASATTRTGTSTTSPGSSRKTRSSSRSNRIRATRTTSARWTTCIASNTRRRLRVSRPCTSSRCPFRAQS